MKTKILIIGLIIMSSLSIDSKNKKATTNRTSLKVPINHVCDIPSGKLESELLYEKPKNDPPIWGAGGATDLFIAGDLLYIIDIRPRIAIYTENCKYIGDIPTMGIEINVDNNHDVYGYNQYRRHIYIWDHHLQERTVYMSFEERSIRYFAIDDENNKYIAFEGDDKAHQIVDKKLIETDIPSDALHNIKKYKSKYSTTVSSVGNYVFIAKECPHVQYEIMNMKINEVYKDWSYARGYSFIDGKLYEIIQDEKRLKIYSYDLSSLPDNPCKDEK